MESIDLSVGREQKKYTPAKSLLGLKIFLHNFFGKVRKAFFPWKLCIDNQFLSLGPLNACLKLRKFSFFLKLIINNLIVNYDMI